MPKLIPVLLWLVTAGGAYAQATFGSIAGTVTDPAGAVVPNAAVQVSNQQTGFVKRVSSDSLGNYEATHLNPGIYSVSVQAAGFKRIESRDILVETLRTVRINIPLEVGDVGAEVTVTAATPVVETESSGIDDVKTAREMRDLPLNFVATSGLLTTFTSLVPTGYLSLGAKFAMGGARGTQLYYSIDGVSANSPLFGVQNSFAEPSLGSVSEMRFDMVNNRAEFGEVTNATVITKSGTNQLHGRLFWMNTTSALNARPYFSPSKAQNIINDFGASIGGPVRRNKTFVYGAFEALRQRQSTIVTPSLPTLKMRRGDFSELLARTPATVVRDPVTGQPYAGNIIPSSLFNPAAVKWQEKFFPSPNFGPPDLFVANFRAAYPSGNRQEQFDIRGDHYFSQKNTFYARVSYRRNQPHALDSGLPPDITGYRVQVRNGRLAAISDTWTLSPRLINEFKAGFSRNLNPREGVLKGQPLIDELGIQGLPPQPATIGNIPIVQIQGFQQVAQAAGQIPAENTYQFTDQITYIRGRHTIKAGYELRPQQSNDFIYPQFGTYSFTNRFTGFGYSDFLLGLPQTTQRTLPRPGQYSRYFSTSAFVQDDFKVSPTLSVSYGLRYEYDKPAVDKYDTVFNFDPRTGGLVVPTESVLRQSVNPAFPSSIPIATAQQANFPTRPLRNSDRNNFQPRVGFAWRPWASRKTGTSVFRGGYGIFTDDLTADIFSRQYGGPFRVTESFVNNIVNNAPILTFTRPFLQLGAPGAVTIEALAVNLINPQIQQWNFTYERELFARMGLRLSYIGTKSSQLIYRRNINQPVASTVPFNQNRRPYPQYQNINMNENGGNQMYHALSTEVQRRWHRGLSFQSAWTWAKNIADTDEQGNTEGGPLLENTYNRARERSDVQFNPRHRFFAQTVWELPFGSGRHYLNTRGPANWILGGWQLTATYTAQTGEFLTPSFAGTDPSNTTTIGGIPDRIANGNLPKGERSINRWFDASAFVAPPVNSGRFGNSGKGVIVGPGRKAFNAGLFKSFKPVERLTVRFQATYQNVFNHANFGNPNLNISIPAAVGTITSQAGREGTGPRNGLLGIYLDF
ncbi:MAG TPA: TonB-dependent receptor [Bryobacteraceae bacterium]|nr:TonB-dependent receptor [Bryobacteraceae bacterium]